MARRSRKDAATVIVRREEVVEGGHHGGAWKVAYADFVTAMMAFFLVMWLINATTEKQRRGLADYFNPLSAPSRAVSGSGRPFGGLTPYETGALVSNRGAMNVLDSTGASAATAAVTNDASATAAATNDASATATASGNVAADGSAAGTKRRSDGSAVRAPPADADPASIPIEGDSDGPGASGHGSDQDEDLPRGTGGPAGSAASVAPPSPPVATAGTAAAAQAASSEREQAALEAAAGALRASLAADASVAAVAGQLSVAVTPDGLRIQISDTEDRPMFEPGSAEPNPRARLLLAHVAPVLARLDEPVSLEGHTDGAGCLGACRSNWDLSAERAEATRIVLEHEGLRDQRIADVTGYADRRLLRPDAPLAAENRRVVMIVHRLLPAPQAESAPAPAPVQTRALPPAPGTAAAVPAPDRPAGTVPPSPPAGTPRASPASP